MRAYVPHYEMLSPRKLPEALTLLGEAAGASESLTPFAGGTDLMVVFETGQLPPGRYLNLLGLRELKGIRTSINWIELGALTTFTEIREHAVLAREFPMLVEAARETGAWAIQNRGTLGGNIINASPAADSPPALLAYDAELVLASRDGTRTVPISEFFLAYKQTARRPDELLAAIRLPRGRWKGHHYYRKVGTRKAQAISKVVMAAWAAPLTKGGKSPVPAGSLSDVRIVVGSVGPVTLRLRHSESVLRGQKLTPALVESAVSALEREIGPIDDIRSTRAYRLKVSGNLLREFLERVGGKGRA
ncbi:MAG: xanthine dehydrogenase family protein subunit M [Bacteriovoracia bacterium]